MSITYEYRVKQAIEQWLTKSQTRDLLISLSSLLGCEHLGDTHLASALPPPGMASEKLIQQTWVRMLIAYDQSISKSWIVERHIIAGLLQNDRWHVLLDTEDDARAWISLLARFQSRGAAENKALPLDDINMNRSVADALRGVLIEWLAPYLGTGDYVQRDFAQVFFGDAWCAMVLEGCAEEISLATLLDSTRPPFLPGRLNIDSTYVMQNLPDLSV
jgi:hypothetical protein